MLFRRSSSHIPSDIDGRLAAFDESYAQRFPDDPQPWNPDAKPASTRRLILGKTRWWWFSRTSAALLGLFILLIASAHRTAAHYAAGVGWHAHRAERRYRR